MSLAALRAALGEATCARLGALDWCESLDSTNAELLRRGAAQPDLALLVADAQSAGRGRRGRAWQSPPDAQLILSLYVRLEGGMRSAGGLSLAVGVAAAEALHALGAHGVRLKWPNDLVADGRKLGGILIEASGAGAVVGVGINLDLPDAAATAIDQPWTDLARLGVAAGRDAAAAALLAHLLPRLERFRDAGLDADLRARWEALDAFAGARVRVDAGPLQHEGRNLGLAPDGALRLATAAGERCFHSGEVSLRRA
jgi:BirA family transcriptional regulator, biotin operon repressor / biotin---[acetyl-CoA-carboxylase] ligase